MRRPFLSGNWKMNLDQEGIAALCNTIKRAASEVEGVEIGVFPPYPYLGFVAQAMSGTDVAVGGQDLYFEKKGAFTGQVSGDMLEDVGASCVLIGHSERRHVFGETLDDTCRKILAALDSGLNPVLCVGEQLDEREAGRTADVVLKQLDGGLSGVKEQELGRLIIAYEPVWAIGTGVTATPELAGEAHDIIRQWFGSHYSAAFADTLRILYGGSVTPDNVDDLMAVEGVDGTLVGGASLKPESFDRIIRFKA